jgi:hypothetical protein
MGSHQSSKATRTLYPATVADWLLGPHPTLTPAFYHGVYADEEEAWVEERLHYSLIMTARDELDKVRRRLMSQVPLLTPPYALVTSADGRLTSLVVTYQLRPHTSLVTTTLPIDNLLLVNLTALIRDSMLRSMGGDAAACTMDTVVWVWVDSIQPADLGLADLPWVFPTDGEEVPDD